MRIEILLITNDTYIIKKIETLLKGNMNLKIIDKINSNLEIDYSLDLIILDLDVLKNKYNNFLISLSKGFTNSKIRFYIFNIR